MRLDPFDMNPEFLSWIVSQYRGLPTKDACNLFIALCCASEI